MRVLLANDGSPSAQHALALVGALEWGSGTTIRVLRVLPSSFRTSTDPTAHDAFESAAREGLFGAGGPHAGRGLIAERTIAYGDDVPDRIVAEAQRWNADLIVTGSHGYGPIKTMLLGSVAAAVIDTAWRPVLVARRPTCERVLFADDGSDTAAAARELLSAWPIFRAPDLRLVTVAHVPHTMHTGIAPTMLKEARRVEAEMLAEARAEHERIGRTSLAALQRAGLTAAVEVRTGDAAGEILASAKEHDIDLIVMGSHGRTGVRRVLLGSVARNVLLHAPSSVLIVRTEVPRG